MVPACGGTDGAADVLAGRVNEPGSLVWNELCTDQLAGGTVLIEPARIPVGISVTLRDPQGAVLGVLQDTD